MHCKNILCALASGGQLLAFDLSGGIKWLSGSGGPSRTSPLLNNHTIYTNGSDQKLYAFSSIDGSLKWTRDNFNPYPVVCNNEIFLPDFYGRLNCIDAATGNSKWMINGLAAFAHPYCVVDSKGQAHHIAESGGEE
jgi:outer membrane protein assembly factor BamB